MYVSEITNTTVIRSQQFTSNLQVQNACGNPFLSFFLSFFFVCLFVTFFLSVVQQPNSDLVGLIFEVSRSHTNRHTPGRNPLNEWAARHRNRYILITQGKQQMNIMFSSGFDPAIPAIKVLQTYSLDRTATGTSWHSSHCTVFPCTV